MRAIHTIALALVLALGGAGIAEAQPPVPPDDATADERTPPRLSYVDGQVSFWRPGAPEWVAAQINTALAPGDELSTGAPGNVEVQIGARAFVRAWAGSVVGLVNQEPDFLQLKVTAGHVALDLRTLDAGRTVELDTPNAAFTIEHPGYYRVLVQGDRTSFISRRGGRATVTPASGQAVSAAASEEVVVEGADGRVASFAAPPLDEWDRWNYARTDYLAEAVSARHVSPGVYGVSDLDRYGRWRTVSDYGSVWVPTAVSAGWAPYSTGSWTWDPYYGWTWVDTEPWGWAPFHYGRWVFVDSYWAWAPGPVIVRPAYSPALVAFFGGGPSVSVRVGWVALGWGEPVIRWWGAPRHVGAAWWGGWGGPRVVNNVVINRGAVVNVQTINVYRNVGVHNAVVVVDHQRFGRGSVAPSRVHQGDVRGLEIVRGRLDVKPVPVSLAPTTVRGARPSDDRHVRPVVATRAPQARVDSAVIEGGHSGRDVGPSPRIVPAPRPNAAVESPRAPIGQGRSERPQPSPPPRFGGQPRTPEAGGLAPRQSVTPPAREGRPAGPAPSVTPRAESRPQAPTPRVEPRPTAPAPQAPIPRADAPRVQPAPHIEAPRPQAPAPRVDAPRPQAPPRVEAPRPQAPPRVEAPRPQARPLPGEAADRMSPGRGEGRSQGRPDGPGERR